MNQYNRNKVLLAVIMIMVLVLGVGAALALKPDYDNEKIVAVCTLNGVESFRADNLEVAYINQAGTMLLFSTKRRVKEVGYKLHDGEICESRNYKVNQDGIKE